MLPALSKRVILLAGHYGSGKSTVALGLAETLRSEDKNARIALADLDIVNPYFRTADCADVLEELGVELIASEYAGSNVDVPAMPASAYRIVSDRDLRVIVDVGGDDRGALAMGRYAPGLTEENDFDMLAVINRSRPLTRTPEDTVPVLREIEAACGLSFTGIVNCTNFGRETTADTIVGSADYAEKVSALMKLPVVFTAAESRLVPELPADMPVLPVRRVISHGGIINY